MINKPAAVIHEQFRLGVFQKWVFIGLLFILGIWALAIFLSLNNSIRSFSHDYVIYSFIGLSIAVIAIVYTYIKELIIDHDFFIIKRLIKSIRIPFSNVLKIELLTSKDLCLPAIKFRVYSYGCHGFYYNRLAKRIEYFYIGSDDFFLRFITLDNKAFIISTMTPQLYSELFVK